MRGRFTDQGGLFSYIAPDKRVPANHLLRKVRELVRDVLSDLNRSLGRLYASEGRPSIPPEQLLSALLLQVFYGPSVFSATGTSGSGFMGLHIASWLPFWASPPDHSTSPCATIMSASRITSGASCPCPNSGARCLNDRRIFPDTTGSTGGGAAHD